jgi:carbonic anhydrase
LFLCCNDKILFKLGDFTQNRLFFEYTRHVLEADERVPFVVNKLSLQDIVKLPKNGHHMSTFNYDGSLTTPPCTENVRWMIVESSSKITPYDLINLRKLKDLDGKNIKTNHRPIQDIYDREIEC